MKYIIAILLTINIAYADDLDDFEKYTMTPKDIAMVSEAIKKQLRDPDSLQIRSNFDAVVKRFKTGFAGKVCVSISAKNAYGGYGDQQLAIVNFTDTWSYSFVMMTSPTDDAMTQVVNKDCKKIYELLLKLKSS